MGPNSRGGTRNKTFQGATRARFSNWKPPPKKKTDGDDDRGGGGGGGSGSRGGRAGRGGRGGGRGGSGRGGGGRGNDSAVQRLAASITAAKRVSSSATDQLPEGIGEVTSLEVNHSPALVAAHHITHRISSHHHSQLITSPTSPHLPRRPSPSHRNWSRSSCAPCAPGQNRRRRRQWYRVGAATPARAASRPCRCRRRR